MRELKRCRLYFDNVNCVYKPGEAFTVFLEITITTTKVIRGIFFEVLGSSLNNGSTNQLVIQPVSKKLSNLYKISAPFEFSNKDDHSHKKFYVLGNGDEIIELPPGEYIFPFRYRLPVYLPPTWDESAVHISYTVRATLDQVSKPSKSIEAPFIIQALPLIEDPNAKKPGTMTLEKKFKELPNSKPLKAIVTIPQLGISPGQTIPLKLEVNNESDATVYCISIKLRQVVRFRRISKKVKLKIVITKDDLDLEIEPRTSNNFIHNIEVPANLTFFDLTYCELVDVDYDIKVEFHTPGFADNLIGKMRLYPVNHILPFTKVTG